MIPRQSKLLHLELWCWLIDSFEMLNLQFRLHFLGSQCSLGGFLRMRCRQLLWCFLGFWRLLGVRLKSRPTRLRTLLLQWRSTCLEWQDLRPALAWVFEQSPLLGVSLIRMRYLSAQFSTATFVFILLWKVSYLFAEKWGFFVSVLC